MFSIHFLRHTSFYIIIISHPAPLATTAALESILLLFLPPHLLTTGERQNINKTSKGLVFFKKKVLKNTKPQTNLENLCPLHPGNKQTGDCFELWNYSTQADTLRAAKNKLPATKAHILRAQIWQINLQLHLQRRKQIRECLACNLQSWTSKMNKDLHNKIQYQGKREGMHDCKKQMYATSWIQLHNFLIMNSYK